MFSDISGCIVHNPPACTGGVAVLDVDGDGKFEFVVAGNGGPNRVYRWVGGRLHDTTLPALADHSRFASGVAAGDIDGDGAEELYVRGAAGPDVSRPHPDRLFKRSPDGAWDNLLARPENRAIRNVGPGGSVVALDRRGVGRYGFFVSNENRPARLYELGSDGLLADLAPSLGIAHAATGRGMVAAPLFGSHTDLFVTEEDGPNVLFRNRGDGTFRECAGESRLADPNESGRGVTVIDVGGQFALCWGNKDGPHRFMVPQPDLRWRDRATPGLAFPAEVETIVAADFDNDGADELFFTARRQPNRLFRVWPGSVPDVVMLDPGWATDPEGFGTGAAVADIDGDGVLELLIARGEQSPLALYKAITGNAWLRVLPLTRFGAPARGAIVRLAAAGRVRRKVIHGGSGSLCQMEPVAHFGLGTGGPIDCVAITWPDGTETAIPAPQLNQMLTVPYPLGV